jgi:hypothetical protein
MAFASSDSIAQLEGPRLTLELIMQFLSVTVAVGYVLVGRVVRPGHAGTFNNFFGTSITALATQPPLCGSTAARP